MNKDLKSIDKTKYGIYPYLRRSGLRGRFHSWEEQDEGLIKKEVNIGNNMENNNEF